MGTVSNHISIRHQIRLTYNYKENFPNTTEKMRKTTILVLFVVLLSVIVDHANCDWFVCARYREEPYGTIRTVGDITSHDQACNENWGYFGSCGMCKYGYAWWTGWGYYCCESNDSGCKCPPNKKEEHK